MAPRSVLGGTHPRTHRGPPPALAFSRGGTTGSTVPTASRLQGRWPVEATCSHTLTGRPTAERVGCALSEGSVSGPSRVPDAATWSRVGFDALSPRSRTATAGSRAPTAGSRAPTAGSRAPTPRWTPGAFTHPTGVHEEFGAVDVCGQAEVAALVPAWSPSSTFQIGAARAAASSSFKVRTFTGGSIAPSGVPHARSSPQLPARGTWHQTRGGQAGERLCSTGAWLRGGGGPAGISGLESRRARPRRSCRCWSA
jgi:hypothetical protein